MAIPRVTSDKQMDAAKRRRFSLVLVVIGALLSVGLISVFIWRFVSLNDETSDREIGAYTTCKIEYQGKMVKVVAPEADRVRALWNGVIRNGFSGFDNSVADDFNFYSGNYTTFLDANGIETKVYLWNLSPSMAKFDVNGAIFYCHVGSLESSELKLEFRKLIARGEVEKKRSAGPRPELEIP